MTETIMLVFLCAASLVIIVLLLTAKNNHVNSELEKQIHKLFVQQDAVNESVKNQLDLLRNQLHNDTMQTEQKLENLRQGMHDSISKFQENNNTQIESMRRTVDEKLDSMRKTLNDSITGMQQNNNLQLENIRKTVDEKLQDTLDKKLNDSFKLVSDQLEQVYKGIGEMQTLANGVGDIKKVLSNVKTRGILGEVQLGAILEQILSPDQYSKNVPTKPGSRELVEYAVKLPGSNDKPVWLPIDAKFPMDAYQQVLDAYDSCDAEQVDSAVKQLKLRIKSFAKDVRSKYLYPPETTDFAIMFLPTEGLYAEVVKAGMIEELQHDYRISIAGPTTMGAFLNSLQMGFKTLAIQKRSNEVWTVLGAVKSEFDNFAEVLSKAQKKLNQANSDLDELIGTRTRQIQRKLKQIESLPIAEAERVLDSDDENV